VTEASAWLKHMILPIGQQAQRAAADEGRCGERMKWMKGLCLKTEYRQSAVGKR